MNILAIDPGTHNGIAKFRNGVLDELETVDLIGLFAILQDCDVKYDLVIMEDSRMQTYMFTGRNENRSVALSMARKVGQVDCICTLIHSMCFMYSTQLLSISPKQKGKKINGEKFKALTGWEGKTNPHTRDAAMVGWNYRNAAKVA